MVSLQRKCLKNKDIIKPLERGQKKGEGQIGRKKKFTLKKKEAIWTQEFYIDTNVL